jgi:dihydropteroate synthase
MLFRRIGFSFPNRDAEPEAGDPMTKALTSWRLRSRTLALGQRTLVMGIVNITPDSFSDGGSYFSPEAAVTRGLQVLEEGADLLDLGAESTRPGSRAGGAEGTALAPAVSADEEQARLLPVLEGILKARPNAVISIDTYKAATARAALIAGAEIVNDVSGFSWDPEMAAACAESRCGVVLMHTRGRPEDWRAQPRLASDELLFTVRAGLAASLAAAVKDYALLARQAELLTLGCPLLAGVSRKSFLGRTLAPLHAGHDAPVEGREAASLAALVAAILHGASVVRVHAVRPALEAALIADAVVSPGSQRG